MLAPTLPKSQAYALHYGSARTPIALVVPDSVCPVMYRIRWPSGELSDMVNLSRAKDAARARPAAPRSAPLPLENRPPREARKGIPGAFERRVSRGGANMKPAHLTRHEVSRRLDRTAGRWMVASPSTAIAAAMINALARQNARSTPESPRSTPGIPAPASASRSPRPVITTIRVIANRGNAAIKEY